MSHDRVGGQPGACCDGAGTRIDSPRHDGSAEPYERIAEAERDRREPWRGDIARDEARIAAGSILGLIDAGHLADDGGIPGNRQAFLAELIRRSIERVDRRYLAAYRRGVGCMPRVDPCIEDHRRLIVRCGLTLFDETDPPQVLLGPEDRRVWFARTLGEVVLRESEIYARVRAARERDRRRRWFRRLALPFRSLVSGGRRQGAGQDKSD